ncbi:hypothetical protein Godav_018293 [Gossypium davidsonii]|uniref:Uncharacterized protein n=2 Tax=Gossypium TaxID=3633 RepID=A0A7J8QWS9_GOSDV|nr:hypothetical protein [Gossypium davidsonii]MBA0640696.1 hypothetical protein [Gossypium klotzschianum]
MRLKRALSSSETTTMPKGHFVIYVGEAKKKRFFCLALFPEASFIPKFTESG